MVIEWTAAKLELFVQRYRTALEKIEPHFEFEGVVFHTPFAGYWIEWLDQQFEHMEERKTS